MIAAVLNVVAQRACEDVQSTPPPSPSYQSLPLRPQNLYIVGAGLLKLLAINALIKFASVFSNSKVLARIQVRWCGGDACACVLGVWVWELRASVVSLCDAAAHTCVGVCGV